MPEDTTDDVLDLVAGAIEERFGRPVLELQQAVAAGQHSDPALAGVLHWYGLAVGACGALQQAEDALLDSIALDSETLGDDLAAAADRVNAAVASYHARLETLLHLLQQPPSRPQDPGVGDSLSTAAGRRPAPAPTRYVPPAPHPPHGAPRGAGR